MSFAVTHFAWHLAFLRQFIYARKYMIALSTQTCQQCCFTSAVLNSSPRVEVHFVQDVKIKLYIFTEQERSQKGDSGCASEKLGVPHLLSD